MHGITNRDTHLYLLHNSSVHLRTITEVRRSQRINDGTRSGWTTLRDSALSSPTSAPTILEWSFQQQRGSDLNTLPQCRTFPLLLTQMGLWPPLRPVSVAEKNKPSTTTPSNVQSNDLYGLHGLTVPVDETIEWLLNTCTEI